MTSMNRRSVLKTGGVAGIALASGAGRVHGQEASPASSPTASAPSAASQLQVSGPIEIEYWQYELETKVNLVNELIPEFQAANPDITIKHVNFPYDDFQTQVAAAVQAGEGPDVLNVYFGWIAAYAQQQLLVPFPEEVFPAAAIESEFFPMVAAAKIGDAYYALPTAVRTLALFCNNDHMERAGISAPTTWDELVAAAEATVEKDGDTFKTVGITYDIGGQGHNWWREALIRQNGGTPISDDNRTLNWTSEESIEAFDYATSFLTDLQVTQNGFDTDGQTAFGNGHAGFHVDGSYRVGSYKSSFPDLNYSVVPLPAKEEQASFASFWANTITRNAAEGDAFIASAKWVDFLSSAEVQRRWTPAVGELPARQALASEEQFTSDPLLKPFIDSLAFSYATFMVNEADLRAAVMTAFDQVVLEGIDPQTALQEAQDKVQAQLDEYWSSIDG